MKTASDYALWTTKKRAAQIQQIDGLDTSIY